MTNQKLTTPNSPWTPPGTPTPWSSCRESKVLQEELVSRHRWDFLGFEIFQALRLDWASEQIAQLGSESVQAHFPSSYFCLSQIPSFTQIRSHTK